MQETRNASLISLETELDPHLIPDLNNLVTGYLYPYLDGEKFIQKSRGKIKELFKEQRSEEQLLRFKEYKKNIEEAFEKYEPICEKSQPRHYITLEIQTNMKDELTFYLNLCHFSSLHEVMVYWVNAPTVEFNIEKVIERNLECLDPEFFPNVQIEIEAANKYKKALFEFNEEVLKRVEKYSKILETYFTEAFGKLIQTSDTIHTLGYLCVNIPDEKLENDPLSCFILETYCKLCNFIVLAVYPEYPKMYRVDIRL